MPHYALPLATPLLDLPSVFDLTPIPTSSDNTPPNQHAKSTRSLLENHPSFLAALRLKRPFSPTLMPPDKARPLLPTLVPGAVGTLLSRRSAHVQPAALPATDPLECVPLLVRPAVNGLPVHSGAHDNVHLHHASKMQMADYLRSYQQLFAVTPQRMRMIVEALIEALEAGLREEGQRVPMIPTFVFGWPANEKAASYLAVDLGSSDVRVWHMGLQDDGQFEITEAKYKLPKQEQQDGEKLCDFAAESLHRFINDQYMDDDGNLLLDANTPLSFTFSHPRAQKDSNQSEWIPGIKDFEGPDLEGRDVGEIFSESLRKLKVPIKLTSVFNNTKGTTLPLSCVRPATRIGLFFGRGYNAAYMEMVSNIPKIASLSLPPKAEMAINCEWGSFDSGTHEHLPQIKYDRLVDEMSERPGEQAFVKMISGLYLGEIFRVIIAELIEVGILFWGQDTCEMEKSYCFDTDFLGLIEGDCTKELLTVAGIFKHFFGLDTAISERQFFRRVAELIGTRSARLSACGIAAIVSKMGMVDTGCEVAVYGNLYNKYPQFPQRIHEALVDIFGEKGRLIKTYHTEDGSAVESGIIAAMAKAKLAESNCNHG
ncbi:hypothetical protein PCASD_23866 [Puccinia coronata f. sp. avenae]|uniref:Phosphotransferase n=1 Tax=Puccinia coronata f. sp. avenae TaxID=200324 RepID=A0A2N5RXY5_9BASI|nr:hypothetical protein PCASD_23866 [Puccinia coronata f. sp. avenae]